MNPRKVMLLIGMTVLFLAVLACTINFGGPAYPSQAIPISTEAAGELTSNLQTAVAVEPESGRVTLVINEVQATSYLAARLQTQTEAVITNPQVLLRDGQIQIYGTARQGYFQVTIAIIVTAGVDLQGQLTLELTSADFGPLPVPTSLKDAVTAAIREAYTGAIGPAAVGFRLESITVADGTMTVVGRTK